MVQFHWAFKVSMQLILNAKRICVIVHDKLVHVLFLIAFNIPVFNVACLKYLTFEPTIVYVAVSNLN